MGCISSKVSPAEGAAADNLFPEEARSCSVPSREGEPPVQGTPTTAACPTPELSEDEDVTYASSSEDESSHHIIGRQSNTSQLFGQPAYSPVHGAASNTDPQTLSSREASLAFFKPSKVIPTNTALRGFATESQVLFFKKLDERIGEVPEVTT